MDNTAFYCDSRDRSEVVLDIDASTSLDAAFGAELMGSPEDLRSMVRVRAAASKPYAGFREGRWYNLPSSFWRHSDVVTLGQGDSNVVRMDAFFPRPLDVRSYRLDSRVLPVTQLGSLRLTAPTPQKLVVKNVGQGNLNELWSDDRALVYDLGADRSWSSAKIRALLNGSALTTAAQVFALVVSHWDVDHYQAALELSSVAVAPIAVAVLPYPAPNTRTVHRAYHSIQQFSQRVIWLPHATVQARRTRRIALVCVHHSPSLDVLRATPGASKNQCGIVLHARGDRSSALLTADHHYDKIADAIGPLGQLCELVVPHHGGRAGQLDYGVWSRYSPFDATVSYGIGNQHGHPVESVLKCLTRSGATLYSTTGGDVVRSL